MCTNPIKLIITSKETGQPEEVTVKCGKCATCLKQRRSDWTIKLIKEAKYHKKACFITLTFDNKILLDRSSNAYKYGANPSFIGDIKNSKKYFQKFIKRLRKKFKEKRITYYHVGEYGEKTHRPHHHVILFGINFEEDRRVTELSKSGFEQFDSQTLNELWACGRTRIQDINSNNIAYIASYSLKKYKTNYETWKKYKPTQSFSNRSKMNVRFIRKYPELIKDGYLQDDEGKKYRVPESYKKTLNESDIQKHRYYYEIFENKQLELIGQKTNKEQIEHEKIKEKIAEIRTREKIRDF